MGNYRHTHGMGWRLALVVAELAALGGSACRSTRRTELMVGIATDFNAPLPLSEVHLEVFSQDHPEQAPIFEVAWPISGSPSTPFELPGSFGIYADPGDTPRVRVQLTGLDASSKPLLHRTSVIRLVEEQTLFMRMALVALCMSDADCPPQLTCIEGHCRLPEVNPATLPGYAAGMEGTTGCSSGTHFTNTSTKGPLAAAGTACTADELCVEGTCYKRAPGTEMVMADLVGAVFDSAGQPVSGATVSWGERVVESALPPDATVTTGASGEFLLHPTVPSEVKELLVVATAARFAPQVVTVPLKARVTRYLVPVALAPLREMLLDATQPTMVQAGPRVTLRAGPVTTAGARLRYAVVSPAFGPGRLRPAAPDTGSALQSIGLVYLDVVGATAVVPDAVVTVGVTLPAGLPPIVVGAPYHAWRLNGTAVWSDAGQVTAISSQVFSFEARGPGFWSTNRAFPTSCARGQVRKSDGPCPGARVVAGADAAGLVSIDSADAEGGFCVTGSPGPTAVVVGATTRSVTLPAQPGNCEMPESCGMALPMVVDAGDCTVARPPPGTAP